MGKYKIGDVARLLNLPPETLRYYENRGLTTPCKDENTGYRYYDAWDMNFLLDCKWFRAYGFSLADVERILNSDDLEAFTGRCQQREFELLSTIDDCQRKLKSLVSMRQKVFDMKNHLGALEFDDSPPLVYQRHRVNYEYDMDKRNDEAIKRFTDLMPFVNHTFVIPKPAFESRSSFETYYWGFSFSPEDAIHYRVVTEPPVEYIPSQKAVHTVFWAGGRSTFMDSFHSQVMEPIAAQGLRISGSPYGHLLVRLHEDGEFRRYFEIWAPVERT